MKSVQSFVLIGCGSYARTYIMPNLPKQLVRKACIDPNPLVLHNFQRRFKFAEAYSFATFYSDTSPCVIVIASYHSDHFRAVKHFIDLNPNNWIFIEKPPVISLEEAQQLALLREKANGRIYIGFNRPHSKLWNKVDDIVSLHSINFSIFSIKEVPLLSNHWYFYDAHPSRVVGNLVHWIDLALLILGVENCNVVGFNVHTINSKESLSFTLVNNGGRSVTICASDYGDSLRGVYETIELRTETNTFIIDDFRYFRRSDSFYRSRFYLGRDKGHKKMYLEFFNDVLQGNLNGLKSYGNDRLISLLRIVEELKQNYDSNNN